MGGVDRRLLLWVVLVGVVLVGCEGAGGERAARAPSLATQAPIVMTDGLPGERYPSNGNEHVASPDAPHGAYFSNPPTSGWHLPTLNRPGVYAQPLPPEAVPHFLEHAGVWVLYTCPAGCDDLVEKLQRLVTAEVARGRPVALAPYAAREAPKKRLNLVAWEYLLALDDFDEPVITQFIDAHACRYNPEGGPFCPGVRGAPSAAVDAGLQGFNARR
ncbi:MAG: DUF3105 domain-containing protein [Dehalococcoidia bacterium]|nr:DUF3105 domain-containing protein [Dehalococcoidia bacterium]